MLWDEGMRDGAIEWMSAMANRLPMKVVGRLIGVPTKTATSSGGGDTQPPKSWRVLSVPTNSPRRAQP